MELEAALEKQRNTQVMYNRYVDDGAGSAYASLSPEERRAIMADLNTANERVKMLERQLEVEEYRERYGGLLYTEDTFWNQAAAHYRLGRIGQDINAAYSAYLADPTEANLDYANGLAALERQFTENNQLVLDEEGAILPWLSKTAAGYLPQLFDQTKARVAGGTAGALGGWVMGNPVLGAKVGVTAASGAHAYDQIRGAAYRALIEAGMDEETARAAATDEALLSSLLEMGDTVVDLVTLGGSGALNAIGRAAAKSGSKNKAVKALGGYLLNILGESVEEGAQQGVSIANRNRRESGVGDLFSRTWDTLGNALRGRDPETLLELLTAGREGAKLAAMLGIPAIAVNTAVGKLRDPLRQAWEEANREVENADGDGYNENHEGILIGKSLGAKAKNYDIELPNKEIVHLTEGSHVSHVEVIAGKGRNRKIDEIDTLVHLFPGSSESEWQKKKGVGFIDYEGESYRVNLHWYEEPTVGRVKWKVKADKDGNWFYDDE